MPSVLNSSGWTITWEKAQSSGGSEISSALLEAERSDGTQKQLKARGGDVPEKGKGRNVPSNYSKQLKYPCYSLPALSRYFQHSHRICFQHTNLSLVWARQGVLKPFHWSTSALWHFLCSFVNGKLLIYRHSRGVFPSTLQSLLQWEYKLYFLEKGLQQ